MFQVKSFSVKTNLPEHRNQISKLCDKVDVELQCTVGDYPIYTKTLKNSQRREKQKINKYLNPWKNTIHKSFDKFQMNRKGQNNQGVQKLIYNNIQIRNVNKQEFLIQKILQSTALNKKLQQKSLNLIKTQKIFFNQIQLPQEKQNNGKKIPISMEILYKCYLQIHQKLVKQANLQGKTLIKIVKPFLIIYKKLKQQSSNQNLKSIENKNNHSKSVLKSQIKQLLMSYEPKTQLQKQIKQSKKKGQKIYEQMYQQYQKQPFYNTLCPQSIKQQQNEQEMQQVQNNRNSQQSQSQAKALNQINNEIQNLKVFKSQKNQIHDRKSLYQQNGEKTPEFQIRQRASQIKQRFQQRFKKQLKNLADDAINMKLTL